MRRAQVGVALVRPQAGLAAGSDQLFFEIEVVHAEHDVAEHLDEAAVRIPREARVAGARSEAFDGAVVEADVQDRVHHAGHRLPGARPHRYQQGVLGVAERRAEDGLQTRQGGVDLGLHASGQGAAVLLPREADFGRDREAGRDGDADPRHLGEAGSLAAEQGLHRPVAIGFAGAESIYALRHRQPPRTNRVTWSPESVRCPRSD